MLTDSFTLTFRMRWLFLFQRDYHVVGITWAQACRIADYADEHGLSYNIVRDRG